MKTSIKTANIPCLDGLRGLAALWVLVSHVQILSGGDDIPVLSWGGLAVDLFMMLSGLLMAYHYTQREVAEPWVEARTWKIFWLRRFFRIAPLYYVALLVALFMSPILLDGRNAVANLWPNTATSSARYGGLEIGNVLVHLSFVFGALPTYAFRTPLPDWSIGLEMQFYLAFPFIMLLTKRVGLFRAGVLLVIASLALRWAFKDYFAAFEMPAFLPMKLYVFFIGIWLANSRDTGRMLLALVASLIMASAPAIYYRSLNAVGLPVLVLVLFYLLSDGSLPGTRRLEPVLAPVRRVLSGGFSRYLGDASYGLYLVHLMILIPVAGHLANMSTYAASNSIIRFAICLVIVLPLALGLAWLGHRVIELPGIKLGKMAARSR